MRVVFGWEAEEERKLVGPGYFPSGPTKTLSPKNGEKTQGKTCHSFSDKIAPSQHQRGRDFVLFFFFFFFVLKTVIFFFYT